MSSPYFQKQDAVANMKKRKNAGEGYHPPKRQNVGKEVPKDKRCGVSSPFFQKQDTVAKITKGKKTGEGYRPPKRLPKDQRCRTCVKRNKRCTGTPPFITKCSGCKRTKSICLPQGAKNLQVDEGLPKDQRCYRCWKEGRRCMGTPPFVKRCSSCEKRGQPCVPQLQGVKRQRQPKDQKCGPCLRYKRRCDGTPPFIQRCSTCEKRNNICFPQLQGGKGQVDKELPSDQRCGTCSEQDSKCFGTPPFNTSCRTCIERGHMCKPRDTEMSCEGQLMENGDKCNRCASINGRCDGGIPCSFCIRHGYKCSLEKTKRLLPIDQGCNRCNANKRRCDGERPCSGCRRANNTGCRWTKGKETWVYRPDPSTWPKPTRIDYCAQCRKRAPRYFGGPPMQCNGQFPCNCCLQQAFGKVRFMCAYHLGNGISKQYRLDDGAATKARKDTQIYCEKKRVRV